MDKRILTGILLAVFIFLALPGVAQDYPEYVGYVNDYAHVLSAGQATNMEKQLHDFDNRTTIEIAVVTRQSIGGDGTKEYAYNYAYNLGNYWGVGKRDKNNGIIFLVVMDSHDIQIVAGSGLKSRLTDSDIQGIVDGTVIPNFKNGNPDQGLIQGVNKIIGHLEGGTASATAPISQSTRPYYPPQPPADSGVGGGLNYLFIGIAVLAGLGLLVVFYSYRQSQKEKAEKNKSRLDGIEKARDALYDKRAAAMEAYGKMKSLFPESVWVAVGKDIEALDLDVLEGKLAAAVNGIDHRLASVSDSEKLLDECDQLIAEADSVFAAVGVRFSEAQSAQKECQALLAGLNAAFKGAEQDVSGPDISMTTRKNLEIAREKYVGTKTVAGNVPNTVDWIALRAELLEIERATEQVSKDAARDRGIASKIAEAGETPESMLEKMRSLLDEADQKLGRSDAARSDLAAAQANYERAQTYNSGGLNAIDMYLLMSMASHNVERGHTHHQDAVRAEEQAAAARRAETYSAPTPIHHTGFGPNNSPGLGGGNLGGGSHGGGKW